MNFTVKVIERLTLLMVHRYDLLTFTYEMVVRIEASEFATWGVNIRLLKYFEVTPQRLFYSQFRSEIRTFSLAIITFSSQLNLYFALTFFVVVNL